MSINKIITFTSVVSSVVFGIMQTDHTDIININQFQGVWFGIGRILPTHNDTSVIRCYMMKVTRERGREQNFKQDITLVQDGIAKRYDGYGKIIRSKIRVLFPFFRHGAAYTVQKFDDGQELILVDQNLSPSYALISRTISILKGTKLIFEAIANKSNVRPEYFSHHDCSYKTVSIPILP